MQFIRKMLKNEEGATAIEYGLIAALIAIAIITGASSIGSSLATKFSEIASAIDSAS